MTMALHILLVDDRPDSVLFLGEFLLARGHRVETSGNGAEALEAIIRRTRSGDAYDLLISDVTMPGMDGLALVRELRRRQLLIPTALYTGFSAVNPNLQSQATQLECLAVMEKPLELRRIERLVEEVIARRTGTARRQLTSRATRDDNQPFFGTSRVIVKPGGLRPAAVSEEPRTGALERKSDLHPVVRQPAPPPLEVPPAPAATGQTGAFTAQLGRRTGGTQAVPQLPGTDPFTAPGGHRIQSIALPPPPELPPLPPPPGAPAPGSAARSRYPTAITKAFALQEAEPQQPTTGVVRRQAGLFTHTGGYHSALSSTRIRRGVAGTRPPTPQPGQVEAPPPSAQPLTSSSRAVACAHCRRVFVVLVKQEGFTAMCVNCGKLNRIDPL
jgi:CheY-like chemotaxis protein